MMKYLLCEALLIVTGCHHDTVNPRSGPVLLGERVEIHYYFPMPEQRDLTTDQELHDYAEFCCRKLGIEDLKIWPAWYKGQLVYGGKFRYHGQLYPNRNIVIGLWGDWNWKHLLIHELTHLVTGIVDHDTDAFQRREMELRETLKASEQ